MPLASGAYNTSLYTVTSEDARAASPHLLAAYLVSGQPATVELVTSYDLVPGAAYVVEADNVPAFDGSFTPTPSTARLLISAPAVAAPTTEPTVNDFDAYLFGKDIVWNGNDFVEGPEGDLAVTSGLPNAQAAIWRRVLGSPLPYTSGYSPNSREYVDAVNIAPLSFELRKQVLADKRVSQVTVTLSTSGDTFTITPTFIGDRKTSSISYTVKS